MKEDVLADIGRQLFPYLREYNPMMNTHVFVYKTHLFREMEARYDFLAEQCQKDEDDLQVWMRQDPKVLALDFIVWNEHEEEWTTDYIIEGYEALCDFELFVNHAAVERHREWKLLTRNTRFK